MILYCKDGIKRFIVLGFCFPELTTVHQIIGHELLLPDYSMQDVQSLVDTILDEKLEEGSSQDSHTDLSRKKKHSTATSKSAQTSPLQEKQNDKINPKKSKTDTNVVKDSETAKDESSIDEGKCAKLADKNQGISEKKVNSKEGPPHLTPTFFDYSVVKCNTCGKQYGMYLDYLHHKCVYNASPTICRFCNVDFGEYW